MYGEMESQHIPLLQYLSLGGNKPTANFHVSKDKQEEDELRNGRGG
jgi:hypothetical protein